MAFGVPTHWAHRGKARIKAKLIDATDPVEWALHPSEVDAMADIRGSPMSATLLFIASHVHATMLGQR